MITIFTIPKPFTDPHINIIQTNAIKSWVKLGVDVVLVGDDDGVDERAREFGVKHIPNVLCNEFGTPLLNSALSLVRKKFNNEYLVYVNADIILLKNFLDIFKYLNNLDQFLVVGQRYMLEIKNELEFNDDWEEEIKKDLQKNGFLNQARSALDYFVFRNKSFKNMPAFAVGRVCWDNWMIYESRRRQIHTIEVRDIITPIHQKHDTVAGINDSKNRAVNPEAQNNLKLAGGAKHIFNLDDTSHILDKDGLREKKTSWKQLEKYIQETPEILKYKNFWVIFSFGYRIFKFVVKKYYIKCGNKIFAGWSKELIEEGKYFYAFSHIPVHKLNLPPQTFIIGIIRNPIERVLSHYKMLLHFKEKKINHECMKVEGGWLGDSFSDFLDRVPRKDLLNQLYMFSENFNIDEAIINIKKCSHVFFTENYNEGIKKLSGKLKLDLKPFNERRAHNYFKPKKEDLIKLEKLLEPEIIFYNQVKEIFN